VGGVISNRPRHDRNMRERVGGEKGRANFAKKIFQMRDSAWQMLSKEGFRRMERGSIFSRKGGGRRSDEARPYRRKVELREGPGEFP